MRGLLFIAFAALVLLAAPARAEERQWTGELTFVNPQDAADRKLARTTALEFTVDDLGRIKGYISIKDQSAPETALAGTLGGRVMGKTIEITAKVSPPDMAFFVTDEETRETLSAPLTLKAEIPGTGTGFVRVVGEGAMAVPEGDCILNPDTADSRACPRHDLAIEWYASGAGVADPAGATQKAAEKVAQDFARTGDWREYLRRLREILGDSGDEGIFLIMALMLAIATGVGGALGAALGSALASLKAGRPWWEEGLVRFDPQSLRQGPPQLPWLTLSNEDLNRDAAMAARMFRRPDGTLDLEAMEAFFNQTYGLPSGDERPAWMDEATFEDVLRLRSLALSKASAIQGLDDQGVEIPSSLFFLDLPPEPPPAPVDDLPPLPPGHVRYGEEEAELLRRMLSDGVSDPGHHGALLDLCARIEQTGSLDPDELVALLNEHQMFAGARSAEIDARQAADAEQWHEDVAHRRRDAAQEVAAASAAERDYQALLDAIAGVRSGALRQGHEGLHDAAYDLDRLYNPDGSINADYVQQLRGVLYNHVAREMSAPAEELARTGWADIAAEAAVATQEDLADKFDKAANNMFVRIGAAVLSGGYSELIFQPYTGFRRLYEAMDDAMLDGQDFTAGDAVGVLALHGAEQNLPVNTMMTVHRMRTQQMMGQDSDVTAGDIAFSLAADALAGLNVVQMGGHRVAGRMADTFARETMDQAGYSALRGRVADLKTGAQEALDAAVIKPVGKAADWLGFRNADIPPGRLDPAEAGYRYRTGQLDLETENILRNTQRSPSAATRAADEAFERGRRVGQGKVDDLIDAIDELEARRLTGKKIDPAEQVQLQRNIRNATVRVQGDKHAMNQMNRLPKDAKGESAVIRRFNEGIDAIYGEADAASIPRLAEEAGARPRDVQPVIITNKKGAVRADMDPAAPPRDSYGHASPWRPDGKVTNSRAQPSPEPSPNAPRPYTDVGRRLTPDQPPPKPKGADATKVSMDRDLTMRVRTIENGKVVYRDIASTTTARVYNEELFRAVTGEAPPPRGEMHGKSLDFKDTHLTPDEVIGDPLAIRNPDKLAKRLDQATTDKLHPEAYGAGEADLDTATKDAFRGRDLRDAGATARTMEFKEHHWLKEAEDLRAAASQAADPAAADLYLQQSVAMLEEGQRQLTKQFNNMVVTRTGAMQAMGNAPGSTIPHSLSEGVNVLQGVQRGRITPSQAEQILQQMGTSTQQLAHQMGAYVEGLQTLRAPRMPRTPPIPHWGRASRYQLRGWRDDHDRQTAW